MDRQNSVDDRVGIAQIVYRLAELRAGVEAGYFSGIEGRHQLLRGLVTSHHEIAMGRLKILQGTTSLRCNISAGRGDLFLRAKHCTIKAEQLVCMPRIEM